MPSRDPLLVPFSVERLRVSREHEGLAYGSVRWFAKVQLIVSNYKEYTAPAWNEMDIRMGNGFQLRCVRRTGVNGMGIRRFRLTSRA
jgi:hypothetical protein